MTLSSGHFLLLHFHSCKQRTPVSLWIQLQQLPGNIWTSLFHDILKYTAGLQEQLFFWIFCMCYKLCCMSGVTGLLKGNPTEFKTMLHCGKITKTFQKNIKKNHLIIEIDDLWLNLHYLPLSCRGSCSATAFCTLDTKELWQRDLFSLLISLSWFGLATFKLKPLTTWNPETRLSAQVHLNKRVWHVLFTQSRSR